VAEIPDSKFGALRSKAKKICNPQTIRRRQDIFSTERIVSRASFVNSTGPDLIELFSNSPQLLCLKHVINLINKHYSIKTPWRAVREKTNSR
jgi:hypothetical protein